MAAQIFGRVRLSHFRPTMALRSKSTKSSPKSGEQEPVPNFSQEMRLWAGEHPDVIVNEIKEREKQKRIPWYEKYLDREPNPWHGREYRIAYQLFKLDCEVCVSGGLWYKRGPMKYQLHPPLSAFVNQHIIAIDASGSSITTQQLKDMKLTSHLGTLGHLKYLSLKNCSNVDDWFLSHLVSLRNSLTHLNISGCSQVTERGIASLHQLHQLERLNLSDLGHIRDLDLVAIMLEEANPGGGLRVGRLSRTLAGYQHFLDTSRRPVLQQGKLHYLPLKHFDAHGNLVDPEEGQGSPAVPKLVLPVHQAAASGGEEEVSCQERTGGAGGDQAGLRMMMRSRRCTEPGKFGADSDGRSGVTPISATEIQKVSRARRPSLNSHQKATT